MSASDWLIEQLKDKRVKAREDGELVYVTKGSRNYIIYCPDERYMITIDIVQEGIEQGANVVAFAARVAPSQEAVEYGTANGVKVCYFSDILRLLTKR